ncbi:YifB family Mg chelatase-like AAA ATPase [Marinobacterium sediminicola]|uniref:Magnesium chelatase family protein n=1 Tax=Marinobacterium sediminicola TaxID=518898 RepID=A0ABY1RZL3_9GAMM|nr:YifB family Mg chelatase-like AAA ATPase [Marinobacterium sediminicola]ULG69139.1 YifB family Mg chelatase-like AAA ATPase [Marinobacterium sediminicola]SMR73580.1 magnesium chelatase family protein [Marinobacterium sediminicola]
MSLAVIHTRAQLGIEAPPVAVEVHLSGGLPSMSIVGLPETAVKESRERVRSALINAGFDFPQRRVTINLAPADLPKEGGRYDLAIAIGILSASGQLKGWKASTTVEVIGELALSGDIRPVRGILPAAVAAGRIGRSLVVARENADEAVMAEGTEIFAASHLLELVAHLTRQQPLAAVVAGECTERVHSVPDLADVKGQLQARRALEVAAAGGHNLLFSGPPGSGKSMLASRLPSLLPPLDVAQRLEVAAIASVSGQSVAPACAGVRPFRSPHHTASAIALVGGGSHPRPGEISLAHQGVLFLDELPEFPRRVLEVLREPLETGEILISRAARQTRYPARFQLIAAMNPCPCGYHDDGSDRCICTPDQIRRYQMKISGPLLDRIDLQLQVPALPVETLLQSATAGESSAAVRQRVIIALERQLERQGCMNRELSGAELEQVCRLDSATEALLVRVMQQSQLSARGCHRLLRVARTLADLAGQADVGREQLLEALAFRGLAGGGWC